MLVARKTVGRRLWLCRAGQYRISFTFMTKSRCLHTIKCGGGTMTANTVKEDVFKSQQQKRKLKAL